MKPPIDEKGASIDSGAHRNLDFIQHPSCFWRFGSVILARLQACVLDAMRLFLSALCAVLLLLTGCSQPAKFHGTEIPDVDWGKTFSLQDPTGKMRRLEEFRGKAVVLFFGYTHCPDVCPTTLNTMREVMELLGEDAQRVQVLFVTVDPERDSAQLLSHYIPQFHPSFLGLRGDDAATAAVAQEFKVFYAKQPAGNSYTVDHSTASYAYDPQGRLRLVIRYGESARNVADDLKLLLSGK